MQRLLTALGTVALLSLAILCAGLAAGVGVFIFVAITANLAEVTEWIRYPLMGVALVMSFYVYGISLLLVAPALNLLFGGRLRPYRGSAVAVRALRWYVHCTLTLLVRHSFLEFVTPSPLVNVYYRLMGMKIGRNVIINSTAIADPSLIELDDGVTIGGSASVLAHYAQGGYLVIAPVRIGRGATIGLRAVVMGDVEIGANARVLANSFVLPGARIPADETWAGVPAQPIELHRFTTPDANGR